MSFSRVRDINAWVIRPDGTIKEYDKKSVLDVIADQDDVYNEGRVKIIDASGDVDAGYVFGYSIVTEDKPLFLPGQSRVSGATAGDDVALHAQFAGGWKASSVTFNHAEVKPQINGTSYVWETSQLSADCARTDESVSEKYSAAHRRQLLAWKNSVQTANRAFTDWTAVSRWGSSLHDPQVIVDDAVAAKARELTGRRENRTRKNPGQSAATCKICNTFRLTSASAMATE
jgi:hypothetical protein